MSVRNTRASWGGPARLLHWGLAAAIIGTWFYGQWMVDLPDADLMAKFAAYQLHKSIGLTILTFVVVRSLWRLANPTPELPGGTPRWQRVAAGVSHAMLYLLILAMPVSGWLMVSASPLGIPTIVFGTIPVPHLLGPDEGLERILRDIHANAGLLLAAVVVVHVGAALKHAVIDRDGVFRRMVTG